MSAGLLGGLLLAVSLISVMIYSVSLGQILVGERRQGLARTAACRIAAALLYVWVGLATVHEHAQGPLIGLGIFTVVQWMWWINAGADVRMTRKARIPAMTHHMDDVELTPSVTPSTSISSSVVVTSEIDRLSTEQATMKRNIGDLLTDVNSVNNARRYGVSALIFTALVAVAGLVFGLIVFNRADNAQMRAQQNTIMVNQQQDTITQLRIEQIRLDLTVRGLCDLDNSFIKSYNLKSRAASPQGPIAYDEEFRNLIISASHLQCGIKPPPDLGGI